MVNSNQLAGYRCPRCGNDEPLALAIQGCINMDDDSSSDPLT